MDINFENVGEKVKGLAQKVKPIHFGIVGGILALGYLFLNSDNNETETKYTSTSGTPETETETSTEITSDDLNMVIDSTNSAIETLNADYLSRIADLENTIAGYQSNTAAAISSTNSALSSFVDRATNTEESDTITSQIEAAKQIASYGNTYKSYRTQAVADGIITAAEQQNLDSIHLSAENVGILAGFGSGGADGSSRIIPEDIKAAAGLK